MKQKLQALRAVAGRNFKKAAGAVALAGASIAAHAQTGGIDVSSVTSGVSDAKTAITTIGGSVLGVIVLVAVFMWARRPIK
mgnify:CR=1 FL=1